MTSYLSLSSDFSLLNPVYSVYSYISDSISYYLGYQSSNKLSEPQISNIQESQKDNIDIQDKKINKLDNNRINKLTKSIFSPVSSIQKNISNKFKDSLKNNMEYKYKKDSHVLEKYPKKIQFRSKIKRIQQPNIITNLKRNIPMIRQ